MELFLGWIALSVIVGIAASSKGRSGFGYFLVSLIISPFIAGLLVIALPSLRAAAAGADTPDPTTHVRCPDCRELVRADARKCKHCGTPLIPQQLASPSMSPPGGSARE